MHHKLQNFSTENDGRDSVVRDDNSTSQAENASNDAGSASAGQPKSPVAQPSSAVTAPVGPKSQTGRGRPESPKQKQTPTQPGAAVPRIVEQAARCEVARSARYDPTGENAVACGASAQLL